MNIPHHINKLLFVHDCVIVPGLGGFITNSRPAALNPAQHTFSPPCKRVAFNAGLKNNDGILGNHLAREYGIAYGEAMVEINSYVENIFHQLQVGDQVIVEKVGTLEYDRGKRIQFEPDVTENFLIDSFGLSSIHSPAIRREDDGEKRRLPVSLPGKEIRISPWRLVELIPVAAMLALLFFNPNVIPALNTALADLLPVHLISTQLSNPADFSAVPEQGQVVVQKVGDENITIDTVEQVDQNGTEGAVENAVESSSFSAEASAVKPDAKSEALSKDNNPHKPAEKGSVGVDAGGDEESSSTPSLYHVVGGCFRYEDNAEQFVLEAQQAGYSASNLGRKLKGLYVVALYSSADRAEAVKEQEAIKGSGFVSGSWILEK